MKRKSLIYTISKATILLAILTFLFSCTKKEFNQSYAGVEDAKLIFTVQGIQELVTESNKTASLNKNADNDLQPEVTETKLSDKVVMSTYSEEGSISGNNDLINSANSNLKNKVAAPQKMEKDIKYRILLYYKDDGKFAKSVLATAGTPIEIPVVENREYLWYAYSYNDKIDIAPPPSTTAPTLTTTTNQDLLWASSGPAGVKAATTNVSLPITFKHSLTQVHIKVNKKNLYGDITKFTAIFSQNYLTTATFDIKTGSIVAGTQNTVDVGNLVFTQSTTDPDLREAIYYTASSLTSYKVTINGLDITYVNGVEETLADGTKTKEATLGTYSSSTIGKSLIGNINLNYFFGKKRKILHLAEGAYSVTYSYAGERVGKASYNMFIAPGNFGPNGVVKTVQPHDHVIEYDQRKLAQYLNVSKENQPDIIIVGQYYYFTDDDVTALIQYVKDGGVLFLMSDNGTVANQGHRQFLQGLLGSNVELDITTNSPGAVYKMVNVNNPILNGPFGDVRNKYWGEDASITMYTRNLPSDVEILSYGKAENETATTWQNDATMFHHKKYNFFWTGDAGFLSNEKASGTYTGGWTLEPFATHPTTHYPIGRVDFGAAGNGYAKEAFTVHNSEVYANFLAWALMRAEFYGIKTGGLR